MGGGGVWSTQKWIIWYLNIPNVLPPLATWRPMTRAAIPKYANKTQKGAYLETWGEKDKKEWPYTGDKYTTRRPLSPYMGTLQNSVTLKQNPH